MKKKLAATLSVVLILGLAVLGILAYLTSEDSDVNVMTLGNVKIEQHEYQRATNEDGSYKTDTIDNQTSYVLEDFEQGKPLLPIVGDPNEPGNSPAYAGWDDTIVRMTQVDSYGSMQVFAGKNAQDKFVTVENTGKSDAYVRTLVAIEVGSTDGSLIGKSTRAGSELSPWIENYIGDVVIDGNNYMVYEYIYRGASDVQRHVNGVLPAGDTTYPNLCQVYIKHNATNEDMVAIDGNENGTLDILVLSQAVQTAGFENAETALDTAFGESADKAAEWFAGTKVPYIASDAAQLKNAVKNAKPGDVILVNEDIESTETFEVPSGVTLDIDGVEIKGTVQAMGDLNINGNAKIKKLKAVNGGAITVEEGKTLELNNFSFGSEDTASSEYTITGGKITANYGFFQHGKYSLESDFETGYMYYSYGSDITVYGTFHSQGIGDGLDYVRGKLTIADGGKSIHEKSLWVGQPESWGAMSATLIVEEGGYVQANSLNVYPGSSLLIDAENGQAGNVTNVVCNTLSMTGTLDVVNNNNLKATANGNEIVLEAK